MIEKKTYNPMSKEFQDECKRLELTGRQLTAKYKKEGKTLESYNIPKIKYYNKTNTCEECKIEKLKPHNSARERNIEGNWTGRWLCWKCWQRLDSFSFDSIQKALRGHRTNNLDQNSYSATGDKYQKLACIQFEWEDLNKKYDNYNIPIDCYDPKTEMFHQIRGRSSYYGTWALTRLEYERIKEFETMVIYCASNDGKYIERIYIFPKKEITKRNNITIYKTPTDNRGNPISPWYEKYRVIDNNILIEANKIWKKIINK
jgi:hypothetical protein